MARAPDARAAVPRDLSAGTGATTLASPTQRVLVIDADSALFGLLEEWLTACGYSVVQSSAGATALPGRVDLIVVDIPFPRQSRESLQRIASDYPQTPILALSSTFFAGVESQGAIARALGVAGVLPKPLKQDALIAAVRKLLEHAT